MMGASTRRARHSLQPGADGVSTELVDCHDVRTGLGQHAGDVLRSVGNASLGVQDPVPICLLTL